MSVGSGVVCTISAASHTRNPDDKIFPPAHIAEHIYFWYFFSGTFCEFWVWCCVHFFSAGEIAEPKQRRPVVLFHAQPLQLVMGTLEDAQGRNVHGRVSESQQVSYCQGKQLNKQLGKQAVRLDEHF